MGAGTSFYGGFSPFYIHSRSSLTDACDAFTALGIPDYFDVIKHPMDFSTIQHKLQTGEIQTRADFFQLVRLVFDNALLYNQPGDPV